jgi:abhydrolase domain-containing protein 15
LALSNIIDIDKVFQSPTLAEFEEKLYCRLYGYEDMEQYWERNNPMRDIDEIASPILCINSLDDPVIPQTHIPFDLFQTLPNFHLVTTSYGGHGGFLEGIELESWADKVALEYLEAVLKFEEMDKPLQNGTAGKHDGKNGKR